VHSTPSESSPISKIDKKIDFIFECSYLDIIVGSILRKRVLAEEYVKIAIRRHFITAMKHMDNFLKLVSPDARIRLIIRKNFIIAMKHIYYSENKLLVRDTKYAVENRS
jgi:hypothetical protein